MLARMIRRFSAAGGHLRLLIDRILSRFGLGDETLLLFLACLIGVVTAAAAVAFHELIQLIRDALYARGGANFLYGHGVWLLVLLPAAGGLVVAVLSRY